MTDTVHLSRLVLQLHNVTHAMAQGEDAAHVLANVECLAAEALAWARALELR